MIILGTTVLFIFSLLPTRMSILQLMMPAEVQFELQVLENLLTYTSVMQMCFIHNIFRSPE